MKERKMFELLNKIKNLLKDEGLNKHQKLYDEIELVMTNCHTSCNNSTINKTNK